MSITAHTFLNIEDSHLRVVSGNVYAQAINISGINLDAAHGLQSVTNTGNQTFNTLQLSNETTGLVTTANAQIGQDLVVSGNTTVAKTLTISEHLIASKEATVTGNLHVTTIQSDSNVTLKSLLKTFDEVEQEYPPGPMSGYETHIPGHGVFCTYSSKVPTVPLLTWQQAHDLAATLPGGNATYEPIWYDPYYSTTTAYYGADIASPAVWSTGAGEIAKITSLGDSTRKMWVFWHNSSAIPEYTLLGYGVYGAMDATAYPNDAFNKNEALTDYWESVASTYTSTSGGSPAVSTSGSERLASNTPYGSWVTLKLPYEICLKRYEFTGAGTKSPKEGQIWGSTDGTTWSHVHTFTGGVADVKNSETVSGNTNYYSEYAFITTEITGADTVVRIVEIRYFGTPGPTTLDKGSLTLGRSLDVPRVSRYDVDTETPRPEKLVLDFDTTINSSPTDISGKGNHGVFYGTNINYSSADKAFVFNGTDDYIEGQISTTGGDFIHSFSFWVKYNNPTAGGQYAFTFGDSWTGGRIGYYSNGVTVKIIGWGGGNINYTFTHEPNRWYHVCGTYSGGGWGTNTELYIDGVEYTGTASSTSTWGTNLTIQSNPILGIGYLTNSASGTGFLDGQISNFKIYNVALEPSEVQKLYRLGRTGRSMVISDTAVGIGKVPEAQLDVRGSISATGTIRSKRPMWSIGHQPGSNHNLPSTETIMIWSPVNYDYTGNYDSSTGYYNIPITGYYVIGIRALIRVPTTQSRVDGWIKKISGGTTSRVIIGERLAGSEVNRATNQNMTCQVDGTVYLQSGDHVYAGFTGYTANYGWVLGISGDFNEFYGRLIEEVIL